MGERVNLLLHLRLDDLEAQRQRHDGLGLGVAASQRQTQVLKAGLAQRLVVHNAEVLGRLGRVRRARNRHHTRLLRHGLGRVMDERACSVDIRRHSRSILG